MATTTAPPVATNPLVKLAGTDLVRSFASDYQMGPEEMLNTLMQTVFPTGNNQANPTVAEIRMFIAVAKEYRLNPFLKQIYAFRAQRGGIVPIVPVDGWIEILNRHPQFDGLSADPVTSEDGKLLSYRCTIWRKDRSHPTIVEEFLDECYRDTQPWKSHTWRMLRHKAIIQCARVAFGVAGIYDEDEGERIIESVNRGDEAHSAEAVAAKAHENAEAKLAERLRQQRTEETQPTSPPAPAAEGHAVVEEKEQPQPTGVAVAAPTTTSEAPGPLWEGDEPATAAPPAARPRSRGRAQGDRW